jgi:predicted  nucleic acid-binding Zn-ribbon protein
MPQKFIDWDNLKYVAEQMRKYLVDHNELDNHLDVWWEAREKVTDGIKYANDNKSLDDYNSCSKKSIAGVNESLTELENNISTINNDITGIKYANDNKSSNDYDNCSKKSIAGVNESLTELEGKINTNESDISTINNDIKELTVRIDNIVSKEELAQLTGRVSVNETNISNLTLAVNDVNNALESKADSADLEPLCDEDEVRNLITSETESIISGLEDLDSRITILENTQPIQPEIPEIPADLQNSINTINARLDRIEAALESLSTYTSYSTQV